MASISPAPDVQEEEIDKDSQNTNPVPNALSLDTSTETEETEKGTLHSKGTKWRLDSVVGDLHSRDIASGFQERQLGVTWQNLTVEVVRSDAAINENVASQFDLLKKFKEIRQKPPLRTILSDSHGCVLPGEMLLVLGRPG